MWVLIVGTVLGVLIYYKIIKPSQVWAEKGVPHLSQWTRFANFWNMITMRKHPMDFTAEIYRNFPNDRYVGFTQFGTTSLLIRDLDLIKQIGIKDFDSFPDHVHMFRDDMELLFSKSLLQLHGEEWKQMRATLSPAFTSSKMKFMYHLMAECAEDFTKHFQEKGQVDLEMKDALLKFAGNVIATAVFGINVDAMKNPNDEFYVAAKALTDCKPIQMLKMLLLIMWPKLHKLLGIRVFPASAENFFTRIIKDNIRKRLKEGIIRPDLVHLFLDAQKGQLKHDMRDEKDEGFATVEESNIGKHTKHMELTDDLIVAQAILFVFGGFESVASVSSLVAYELAANPDVQKKLQEEIDEVREKTGEKVPYEALVAMKYLDQVVSETLRLWTVSFQTERHCVKDYTIPPKNSKEKSVLIEKGMAVWFPIMAIHRDPQYFPDPNRFDPERFNDENKSKILPGSYMPFGVGPRSCIGCRFALLETKILFFHLLSKFEIVPNEKTEIPFKICPKKMNASPANGFQLRLKPRNLA